MFTSSSFPADADGLRRTFADAHRRYTGHINARHRWTGHLWQGGSARWRWTRRISATRCATLARSRPRALGRSGRRMAMVDLRRRISREMMTSWSGSLRLSATVTLPAFLGSPTTTGIVACVAAFEMSGRPLGGEPGFGASRRKPAARSRRESVGQKPRAGNLVNWHRNAIMRKGRVSWTTRAVCISKFRQSPFEPLPGVQPHIYSRP